jgi:hypothetical protein
MKNVHLLPTEKPSRIRLGNNGNFVIANFEQSSIRSKNDSYTNQHIYITSDEEIKEDTKPCWCIDTKDNSVNYYQDALPLYNYIGYKKIILTTDQELIKAGVQKIDDEFLEWFVKNPCESVEVVLDEISFVITDNIYKIIIPQEEPKQETIEDPDAYWLSSSKKEREWQEEKLKEIFEHYPNAAPRYQYLNGLIQMALKNIARKNFLETLEEAAERIYDDNLFDYEKYRYGFIEGAKWQAERMYSEEDMKQFGLYLGDNLKKLKNKSIDEIFEQFKNI